MALLQRDCTCCTVTVDIDNGREYHRKPEAVEFVWCLSDFLDNNTSSGAKLVGTNIKNKPSNELLMHNFEKYGWSPIRIRWWNATNDMKEQNLSTENPSSKSKNFRISSKAFHLLCQYPNWRQIHSDLFRNTDVNTNFSGNDNDSVKTGSLRYIPFESGASGTSTPEAKVSWEYQRCGHAVSSPLSTTTKTTLASTDNTTNTNRNSNEQILDVKSCLHAWTEILHHVISHAMQELELPNDQLVVEYCIDDNDPDTYNSMIREPKRTVNSSQQPLDLLRAFRYDPVSVQDTTMKGTAGDGNIFNIADSVQSLGSSPHTDWGSWTVVWQDDTSPPCLQTYCYHCQKWNSVISPPSPPPPPESSNNGSTTGSNVANFIVHVGDITSLCIHHAIIQGNDASRELKSTSSLSTNTPDVTNLWPSPRHRVISPIGTNQYRHSLVYFVYPPATVTPASITESLIDWCHRYQYHSSGDDQMSKKVMTDVFPYEDYSLLSDQSAIVATDEITTNCKNDVEETTTSTTTTSFSKTERSSRQHQQQLRWNDIQDVPVRDILTDKWNQVQRLIPNPEP